jgi:hypothetical protein
MPFCIRVMQGRPEDTRITNIILRLLRIIENYAEIETHVYQK